jgi:hypothetical protein
MSFKRTYVLLYICTRADKPLYRVGRAMGLPIFLPNCTLSDCSPHFKGQFTYYILYLQGATFVICNRYCCSHNINVYNVEVSILSWRSPYPYNSWSVHDHIRCHFCYDVVTVSMLITVNLSNLTLNGTGKSARLERLMDYRVTIIIFKHSDCTL